MKTTSVFVTILLALTLPMIGLSQEFPLGAYVHRPDTATFRQANLRWMVLMTDFKNQTENEVYYLNPANIRLIATRQDSIYAPSRAQRLEIQAEENPNIPFMENYFNIRLTGEPDGNAWWAKPERHIKDYLVRDPVPNDEYYYDRTHYVATFNLKISKTTDPVRPVVKLMVVSAGDSTCLADSILYDGDFASNSYQSFLMHFRIPKPPTPKSSENTAHVLKGSANLNSSSIAKVDIRVYWYDYVETWLDKVVISDTVGQDLFSHGYDDHISADAQYIDSQYPLIQRFLLNDEPPINGHLPFHYVDHVLDSLACPRGWTACCQRYERFIQDGRPYELAVDYYPIKTRIPCVFSANGDSAINYGIVKYENDITYNDSLQKGLDSLIEYENRDMIGNPRFGLKPAIEAAKNASLQRAFWFIPQLHGLLRQSDGKYVSLRNPMPIFFIYLISKI